MESATITKQLDALRRAFASGRTRPLEWRRAQLESLTRMLDEQTEAIRAALRADLGKSDLEADLMEIGYCRNDVAHTLKHLSAWTRPRKVRTPLTALPGRSRVVSEPLGVVLIIAPWNYPFQLAIGPLVAALAAGNCAIVKPSEVASAVSALLADLLPRYLDQDAVRVVEGGVSETTALLAERFDHIFYTGNGAVGRIVMAAAARHLTPVTLELGGKSPVIVDRTADLALTARRIAWGKYANCGQTCVAPDYVLAEASIYEPLVAQLTETVQAFFGPDPQRSPDYGRIINTRHHQRLMRLIAGAEVCVGGQADEADRYLAPTVLRDVTPDLPVMQEEIFGPILPVLRVDSVPAAIRFINERDKPLALYVFSSDASTQKAVVDQTSSGAVVANHVFMHMVVPDLPFGGVGESGMGAYHGKQGFDTFSHAKSVLYKPQAVDPGFMYPPYDDGKQRWLRRLL